MHMTMHITQLCVNKVMNIKLAPPLPIGWGCAILFAAAPRALRASLDYPPS